MAKSLNEVRLIGRLGRDAEGKFTPNGKSVATFSIATDRSWKDQQSGDWKTEFNWTNVVLWGQEGVIQFLQKGKQVYVGGRLQTRNYEKNGEKVYVTEVVAEEIILLGGESGGAPKQAATKTLPVANKRTRQPGDDEDDPFDTSNYVTQDDFPVDF